MYWKYWYWRPLDRTRRWYRLQSAVANRQMQVERPCLIRRQKKKLKMEKNRKLKWEITNPKYIKCLMTERNECVTMSSTSRTLKSQSIRKRRVLGTRISKLIASTLAAAADRNWIALNSLQSLIVQFSMHCALILHVIRFTLKNKHRPQPKSV